MMYGAETWVLSKVDELRLGVFERKILRRIYGPIWEEAIWRSRYNEELQRVSKIMARFQIIISNNENVLQLQNKLQTIK